MWPSKVTTNQRRAWIPLAFLIVGIAWLASGHSLLVARELLAHYGTAGPIAFILIGTGMMSLFVPKTLVSIAAGGLFSMPDGCWVLSATAVVSAAVNYHIGRWSLNAFSQQINDHPSGSKYSLKELAEVAKHGGIFLHLMIRLAPIPTTVISYSMGASGAKQSPYLLAASLATVPQWLWVFCGAMATDASQSIAGWVGLLISATAAIVLAICFAKWFGVAQSSNG